MTEEEDPRPSLLPDPLPPHLEEVLKEKKFYHRNELLACGARGPKAEEPKTKQEKDKQKKSDEKIYIKHVEKGIKRAVERLAGGGPDVGFYSFEIRKGFFLKSIADLRNDPEIKEMLETVGGNNHGIYVTIDSPIEFQRYTNQLIRTRILLPHLISLFQLERELLS